MSCGFCNLDPKRNKVVYDGDLVFVMPSNPRLMQGHLLVIPKRHIEKPWELTSEERKEIFETVLKFQKKVIDHKIATGCDIRQNYRPFLPEGETKVNHVHYHILPRKLNDHLFEKSEIGHGKVFKMMTEEELETSVKLFEETK